jgi:intracellular septation protein
VIYFSKYWVDFKLFGSMAMTLIFVVGQFALLSRYIRQDIEQ